jgi:hypothetical protein
LKQLREAFGIPAESYYDWNEKRAGGYFDTILKQGRKRKIDKPPLRQAVPKKTDAFPAEYAEQCNGTPTVVFHVLEYMGITRKKRRLPIRKNP